MPGWLLWALSRSPAVGEIFTPGLFFLGPLALAAGAAAIVAAARRRLGRALIVFVAGSVASLAPAADRALAHPAAAAAAHRHGRARRRAGARARTRRRERRPREDRRRGVERARARRAQVHRAGTRGPGGPNRGRDGARLRIGGADDPRSSSSLVVVLFVLVVLRADDQIVPQARAGVVERLGRYHRRSTPGLAIVVPFVDRVRPLIDLREQVVSFEPQPVITEDNLVVSIDSVIYFQVTDAEGGDLRDRQLHPGDRAAHGHDAAQRDRRHGAREDADLARRDQQPAARRARRGDGQVGHPGEPRRAEGDRPADVDPGDDGEADARRPREARRDPHRRGRQAVADPHGRGREAGCDPPGRGRSGRR